MKKTILCLLVFSYVVADISITSFYGSHIINCAGNGGMVCFNNKKIYEKAKLLRSWGRSSSLYDENSEKIENRFDIFIDGMNYQVYSESFTKVRRKLSISSYTKDNLVLWTDLEAGKIVSGDRAGTYTEYARTGMVANYIPTDSAAKKFLISIYRYLGSS